jgi:hypothetical protein
MYSSDLHWAVAKATINTVFKAIFIKEALSIVGSKGSSIRALRTKERSLGCATDILRTAVIHVSSQTFSKQPISRKEAANADLYPLMADTEKVVEKIH